jgi:hypothetical protein
MQHEILAQCLRGKNLFFTGSAGMSSSRNFSHPGTGKSFLLHTILSELRRMNKKVAITASTGKSPKKSKTNEQGIAAEHIGGTTLHSLVGVGSPSLKIDFERMQEKRLIQR